MSDDRTLLTALHAAAVRGASPFGRTRDAVRDYLQSDAKLSSGVIHIIALGKASGAMAAGACNAITSLGLPDPEGIVVSAHDLIAVPPADDSGKGVKLPAHLVLCIGDHPVPGPSSLSAADAIEEAVQNIHSGDSVIVLLSGGTTALAAAPVAELSQLFGDTSLAQSRLANLADLLLESGLAIHEMNAIRRRVLRWGAGRLAVALASRGVTSIPVFAMSDVIGDDPAIIGSGPCTPDINDDTYFLALLDAHAVRGSLDSQMERFLGLNGNAGVPSVPMASHHAFSLVDYSLVARNSDAVASLADAARAAGIEHVIIDPKPLEGDAAVLGNRIAHQALTAARTLPQDARALYVMGGEPVVNLRETYAQAWADVEEREEFGITDDDEPMSGGRMQVLALAASLALENAVLTRDIAAWRITILAAGTDGRDGPTDAAGAIVDASVPSVARKRRRSPERDLETGRSWFSLDRADALLRTGPTGTNVMDVVAVLIDRA